MQGLLEQAAGPQESLDSVQQQASDPQDLGDPALTKAIYYVGQRLYDQDMATEIAKVLENAPTAMPKMLAGLAYKLAQAADTATEGEIMEENLSILGMLTLNEVVSVAEAAGMPIQASDASAAMKHMVIMFAEDNGIPADEIAGALAQVRDQDMAQAAMEAPDDLGDQLPDEMDDEPEQEMMEA